MDFLVAGMPRGGTTVAAKFMSLHEDAFCCASETHLIPLLHGLIRQRPCLSDKVECVRDYLKSQLMTTMVEIPRYNVNQGAHPGNLIFDERAVGNLVEEIEPLLHSEAAWDVLYPRSLQALRKIIASKTERRILGEKTPSNIFSMAGSSSFGLIKQVLVAREPFGALRSMRNRSDPYASVFSGNTERNIGVYLEYGYSIKRCLDGANSLLIRYEEMPNNPANVLTRMFALLGLEPEPRVINFVEAGGDREIADRAPMNYRRLTMDVNYKHMARTDIWKILALTRKLRNDLGYTDELMASWGLPTSIEWPGDEVPAAVLPMYGFHDVQDDGHRWMKQEGRLAVYLPKSSSRNVKLRLWSRFPDEVTNGKSVVLSLIVAGLPRESIEVASGDQCTQIAFTLSEDEVQAMGTSGYVAEISLQSSLAFTPLCALPESLDAREVSFLLSGWSID